MSITEFKTHQPKYTVFVSSTFLDNQARRKVVQEAITMAGMVWSGMEIFAAGTRSTVEECVRLAREADILVGIIAWRYGWEPDGKKSITEMEYDAAKERLMFQLDPNLPVNPEQDFDPGEERWDKQKKLEAFQKRFAKDQMPAYFNETTLGAKILDSLNKWRQKRESGLKVEEFSDKAAPESLNDSFFEAQIRSYCQKAEYFHESLPVAGFATHLTVPIDIEDIYIPLRAMIDLRGVEKEIFADAADADKCLLGCDGGLEISLPEAFHQSEKRKKRGIVILGDPGSGKTTHLKRLLLYCLRKGPEDLGLPDGMLPVFLPLRDLDHLDQSLDAFIQAQLANPHLKTPEVFGNRLLERGNLLFLLDGLDEVGDLAKREKVAAWIVEALRIYKTCRFVVTCRFAGYSPTVRLSEQFLEMHIRPFNEDQMERFIQNWYAIVEQGLAKDPEQAGGIADEKAIDLIAKLREPDFRSRRVFELTRNPLLLANICLVHRHRGGLPKKRARLYEECIDVLLEHWRGAKKLPISVSAQEGRRALQPAAYWLHSEEGRTQATAEELVPQMEPILKALNWKQGTAADFLRMIREESGLITGWNQDSYGFMHLGFQEYLAAHEIRSRAFKDPTILSELAARFGESWWQEVTLLMLALEDSSLFEPFMTEVMKQPGFSEYPSLVDACIEDAAEVTMAPFQALLETKPGKDKDLWNRQFAAFRVLSRLDASAVERLKSKLIRHPYEEIRRWIQGRDAQLVQDVIYADQGGYELVRILGGVFMMGSPKSEEGRYDDEGPVHEVHVPDFIWAGIR